LNTHSLPGGVYSYTLTATASRKSKSFKHFAKAMLAQGTQDTASTFYYPHNCFSNAP
jgi:hypothetical protein